MAHAVALGAERLLLARLQPVGALDEVAQRLDAGSGRAGVAGDLLVVPSRGGRARARPRAPRCRRSSCSAPTNASSTSSW